MIAAMRKRRNEPLPELRHRVWTAQRQLHRVRTAYLQEYGSAATGTRIDRPERIYSNTSSDIHLLCHVTSDVVEAQAHVGKSVSLPRLDDEIANIVRLLRDVHSNWEMNRRVTWVPAPTNDRRLSKEARAFIRNYPNKDPFSLTLEAGSPVVADLLDLNDLSSRLFELERAVMQAEGA